MRGGAPVKFVRILSVAAVAVLAASIVRADDTRTNQNGGGSPGDPSCGSIIYVVASDGSLTGACNATATTGTIESFTFEVADSNTIGGGLTCASNLTHVGWTETGSFHNPGGIDVCTFTAPTSVSSAVKDYLQDIHDPYNPHHANDGDCDLDEFVLGIPINCGIHTNNLLSDPGISPFKPGAETGLAVQGTNGSFSLPSLPEPSAFSLLLVGLSVIPFARRKFAKLHS
jgi:hypothetical protein